MTGEFSAGPSDAMIGRVLAGRYRLLEKLGAGGMGVVYKGEHVKTDQLVAIKILASEQAANPDYVARFHREARLASLINHPNAVPVYDFGESEDGLLYLAMQYLDGQSLAHIIRRHGPLPLGRVINITCQAALALDAAHQLGIIHRDFKPENVMVCQKTGWRDWVSVLDFGIAKQVQVHPCDNSLTTPGFILGTPRYMSPEQVKGEPLGPRSDLYSLAITTYEMLTGILPFGASTPQAEMVKRIYELPTPIRVAMPQLAPEVEAIIMKALALDPGQRYSTTVEYATALEYAAKPSDAPARSMVQSPVASVAVADTVNRLIEPWSAPPEKKMTDLQVATIHKTKKDKVPIRRANRKAPSVATFVAIFFMAASSIAYYLIPKGSTQDDLASLLQNTINVGRLVTLSDDDAYTCFYQLKQLAPNHKALREAAPKALPQLRILIEEALRRKAKSQDTLNEQDWARTLRACVWASALSPNDKGLEARQKFIDAEIAALKGRTDDAERSYMSAAQADASWAMPQNSLGLLKTGSKQFKDAIPYFKRAIDLQPDWAAPYNNLAATFLSMKDYEAVAYWCHRALDVNPNWPQPHWKLASLYEEKQMKVEAIAEYQKALNIDADGISLTTNERKSIKQALNRLQK